MKNVPLEIRLPDMLDVSERDLKILLASKLYETRQLSLGQAADAASMSKRAFSELLGHYDVSLFSQTADELKQDIRNA